MSAPPLATYSKFVGDVFGAPLAIEGLAAFFLESVFLFLATGSFTAEVRGLNQLQQEYAQRYGPGNYKPPIEAVYWSMRVMAYLGALMFAVAALGAWLYRRGRLERSRWFLRTAIAAIAFPFVAATAGWVLTEVGRQPWIVQGLLRTVEANSRNVGVASIAVSLGVFVALYAALGVVDFVLMRRYARVDPPPVRAPRERPMPAAGY